MLNQFAKSRNSTRFLEALPGKLDIKKHSPSIHNIYMGGSRGGNRGSCPPLKNHKNIGFPSNTCRDKVTKSAFKVSSSSTRQGNAI